MRCSVRKYNFKAVTFNIITHGNVQQNITSHYFFNINDNKTSVIINRRLLISVLCVAFLNIMPTILTKRQEMACSKKIDCILVFRNRNNAAQINPHQFQKQFQLVVDYKFEVESVRVCISADNTTSVLVPRTLLASTL